MLRLAVGLTLAVLLGCGAGGGHCSMYEQEVCQSGSAGSQCTCVPKK